MPVWVQRLLFLALAAAVSIAALVVGGTDHSVQLIPWVAIIMIAAFGYVFSNIHS